jgi:hypothetical protein
VGTDPYVRAAMRGKPRQASVRDNCLVHADVVVESTKGTKQHVVTLQDGRRLKVVIDTENDIIVSAMWT